jgi:hypothetical protein
VNAQGFLKLSMLPVNMKLDYHCGMLCTEYGLDLLRRKPDFVQSVWENPANREPSSSKYISKIHDGQETYLEKSGVDEREMKKYGAMSSILKESGCRHIRVASPYFLKQDRLLIEFLKNPYNFDGERNEIQANKEALNEVWDVLMLGFSMEFFADQNGDLVILDPHCQIDRF